MNLTFSYLINTGAIQKPILSSRHHLVWHRVWVIYLSLVPIEMDKAGPAGDPSNISNHFLVRIKKIYRYTVHLILEKKGFENPFSGKNWFWWLYRGKESVPQIGPYNMCNGDKLSLTTLCCWLYAIKLMVTFGVPVERNFETYVSIA